MKYLSSEGIKALQLEEPDINLIRVSLDNNAGDTGLLLRVVVYKWLLNTGYDKAECIGVLKYFSSRLDALANELDADVSYKGPLCVLMIQDGRYLTSEWAVNPFDIKKMEGVNKGSLPIPVTFFGLSIVGAYLRTVAMLRSLRDEEEETGSG